MPSDKAKNDASSPARNSSMTTVRPASPKARSSMQAATARSASSRLRQTMAPFPAASPSALTTMGAPSSRQYWRAARASEKIRNRAVGIPWRDIRSLAKALELSSLAAAALGPKTAKPAARKRSASPSASGSSGPTTARSTCSRLASASRSSSAVSLTGTHSAWRAMPGLPGAAMRRVSARLWAISHASACSRPPPPTRSTLIRPPRARPRLRRDGSARSGPTGCPGPGRGSGASARRRCRCGRPCRAPPPD